MIRTEHGLHTVHSAPIYYVHMHACSLQDIFTQKFSATSEQEKEWQLEVSFEYLTKKEMAEDYDMTPCLSCIVIDACMYSQNITT